jgi:hypothetical protein
VAFALRDTVVRPGEPAATPGTRRPAAAGARQNRAAPVRAGYTTASQGTDRRIAAVNLKRALDLHPKRRHRS